MKHFHPLTKTPQRLREEDTWGSGAFNAPRGERLHRGIDIVAPPGSPILAPITGTIVREAQPYDDDPSFSGVLLRGTGIWEGYEIKLFYLAAPHTGEIREGDVLGHAQDLEPRYPGITNHVHLEVWQGEDVVDPSPFIEVQV